jgi:hypothetical protein
LFCGEGDQVSMASLAVVSVVQWHGLEPLPAALPGSRLWRWHKARRFLQHIAPPHARAQVQPLGYARVPSPGQTSLASRYTLSVIHPGQLCRQ